MRAAFYTLGCKVNQCETFAMISQFSAAGYEIVEPESCADVYVLNSCTVTAVGDKKSRQILRRLRRRNPGAVLVLCGCYPQAYPEQAASISEADIVVGAKGKSLLLASVAEYLSKDSARIVDIAPYVPDEPFEPLRADSFGGRTRAFVKIQDGCSRRCAYCIIPTARGPMRSKGVEALREELQGIAAAGYLEVVLVGINLSCYGMGIGLRLTDAVRIACESGLERVRLGSLEPELLSAEDISIMSSLPALCPQFHLSLQSGCDATLRRMRRPYGTAEYRALVRRLRDSFGDCALTTDIMVGFPGETEAEHAESEEFVREMGFSRTHVFIYSPRPGTPACDMPERVPRGTCAERSRRMMDIAAQARRDFLSSQVGRVSRVLFEQKNERGLWVGYTANYTPVCVKCDENLGGKLVNVRLSQVLDDELLGLPDLIRPG